MILLKIKGNTGGSEWVPEVSEKCRRCIRKISLRLGLTSCSVYLPVLLLIKVSDKS